MNPRNNLIVETLKTPKEIPERIFGRIFGGTPAEIYGESLQIFQEESQILLQIFVEEVLQELQQELLDELQQEWYYRKNACKFLQKFMKEIL